MENDKIVEGNMLIAKFMGGKTNKDSILRIEQDCIWLPIHGVCNCITVDNGNGKTLRYNRDYNWLILVVESIQNTNKADVEIQMKGLILFSYNHETKKYYNSTLLENLWEACVDFINWYNNQ